MGGHEVIQCGPSVDLGYQAWGRWGRSRSIRRGWLCQHVLAARGFDPFVLGMEGLGLASVPGLWSYVDKHTP